MALYLLFFVAIALLLGIDHLVSCKRRSLFTGIAIGIVIIFVIFRDYVGYDYAQYVWAFTTDFKYIENSRFEPGFVGVTWLLHKFSLDYIWGFVFFGISIILLQCRGISLYTSHFRLAFIIYLLTPGLFLNSLSILRQSLAIAIVFNGYFYLYKNQRLKYLIYSIVAFLFHSSAILPILVLPIIPKLQKYTPYIILIGVPLSIVISKLNVLGFIMSTSLVGKYGHFYAGYEDQGTSLIKIIVLNLTVVVYYLCYKRAAIADKSLITIVIFGIILMNLAADIAAMTRMSYYFRVFEIVLIPNLIYTVLNKRLRLLCIMLCICYFFGLMYNALRTDILLDQYPKFTPYKSVLKIN